MKSYHTLGLALAAATALIATASPVRASNDDSRIETAVKDSYVFKTFLKSDTISTEAWEGTVTLTGTVSDPSHQALAVDTVAAIPGVKRVDNQLRTKGITPTENSDGWIGMKVKSALLFHRNVSASGTDVTVSGGMVTLHGEAANEAQKNLTGESARDVTGVRSVSNEMTVATNPVAPADAPDEKIDDASITAQVKAALSSRRSTSALSTTIATKDGVVTVTGPAKNTAEVSLVSRLIGDIRGVANVVNNMVAAPTAAND